MSDKLSEDRAAGVAKPRPLRQHTDLHWASIWGYEGDNRTIVTLADLIGVTRIRVSRGFPGRARGTDRVSGLMLEYSDGRTSEVLGQWFEEAGVVELSPGETITEIGLNIIGGQYADKWAVALNGIAAINLTTSGGTTRSFCFGDKGNTCLVRLRHSPYDKLVGPIGTSVV